MGSGRIRYEVIRGCLGNTEGNLVSDERISARSYRKTKCKLGQLHPTTEPFTGPQQHAETSRLLARYRSKNGRSSARFSQKARTQLDGRQLGEDHEDQVPTGEHGEGEEGA